MTAKAYRYHQTELRISLQSMRDNLETFQSFLKEDTDIMLMVKAAAYGHGALELLKHFKDHPRIKYLAVAYVDEGIELRKAGIEKSILVLNPSPNAFKVMIEACLEPEIHNMELLKAFAGFLEEENQGMSPYPIHLKFNTGMNRLGFDEDEIPELIDFLKDCSSLKLRSIMTHLSSSDLPKEDDYSLMQLNAFERIIKETKAVQEEETFFHCLNSNGIFRFAEHQYQMVRLGIGFYGTSALKELSPKLKAASRFSSRICQIRKVKKGDSISYSRSGRAPADTRIATVSIGYADGFSRLSGNGRWEVEINGKLYPTIGNICMDLSMINIGEDDLSIGDEVIIFGGKKSIYDYAEHLGTITYEVMCSIGKRVKRVID